MMKNRFKILFGVVLIVVFLYPMFLGYRNIGGATGILIGIYYFLCGYKKMSVWNKISKCLIVPAVLVGCFLLGLILTAHPTIANDKGTIIVLGCEVNSDGSPSAMLESRLKAALDYHTQTKSPIIVTGGNGNLYGVSEAESMQQWLIDRGVMKEAIYMDSSASSTLENITNAKRIIEENKLDNHAIIITNRFHIYRAQQIASQKFTKVSFLPVNTPWFLIPTYYLRECYGIVYHWLTTTMHA